VIMLDYGVGHEDVGLHQTAMVHVNQHGHDNRRDAYIR
jgi:hypothetical protein